MFTVADVKCYYCGFVSGEVVVERGQPLTSGTYKPVAACASCEVVKEGRPRCCRCNGPVYLDDIRTMRPRPVLTDIRPRRGRPRRSEVLAQAS